MIIRKPALILSSYNSLPPVSPHTQCLHSTSTQPRRHSSSSSPHPNSPSSSHHPEHTWPDPTAPHKVPSPYQILSAKRGRPYSKVRFHQLVKLYHPDLPRHPSLQHLTRQQHHDRYRLVIAAHTLLSDTGKRAAYDAHGAGWAGQPDVFAGGSDRTQWAPGNSPLYNATWEDWVDWRERQTAWERQFSSASFPSAEPSAAAGGGGGGASGWTGFNFTSSSSSSAAATQRPAYLSNGAFVALMVALAALGGIGQATRVEGAGLTVQERRDFVHDRTSKDLRRARAAGWTEGKEGRIENFLRTRDPSEWGVGDPDEEAYKRLLPEREVCESENIKKR